MKNKTNITILLTLLLSGCVSNNNDQNSYYESSTSDESSPLLKDSLNTISQDDVSQTVTETSDSLPSETVNNVLLYKEFLGLDKDPLPFYTENWYAANCKFTSNSVILIEGDDHQYGGGMVRTCSFTSTLNDIVNVKCQLTGFNNSINPDKLLNLTFSMSVSALNDENEEVSKVLYSHVVNDNDIQLGYIEKMNAYSENIEDVATLSFSFTNIEYSKIKVTYNSKLKYEENGKNVGCNLQIFSIEVKENK